MPFRIEFRPLHSVSENAYRSNVEASKKVKRIETSAPHGRPLAICGGGPSLLDNLKELEKFLDIWAINATAPWLVDRGFNPVFVTVDPNPMPDSFLRGVKKAIVAACVDPSIYERLDCQVFDMIEHNPSGVAGGTTTATRMPIVALMMGYTKIHYFGCEGSYKESTHVDRDEVTDHQMYVKANGESFRTSPPMLLQCQELAKLMIEFPEFIIDRSGGLLTAIRIDSEWEISAVSSSLKDHLEEINGKNGLYDSIFKE